MYRAIRGLMQTALDMRAYRRLRVKVFLRSDQVNEAEIANFPDASKVLSSSVELGWPRHELYGLLWHLLVNRENGEVFRRLLLDPDWKPELVGCAPGVHRPPVAGERDDSEIPLSSDRRPLDGAGPEAGFPIYVDPQPPRRCRGQS